MPKKVNYVQAALNKALAGVPPEVAEQVRAYHTEMVAIRKAAKPTEELKNIETENNFVKASVNRNVLKALKKKYPLAGNFMEGKYLKKGGKQKTRKQKSRHAALTRRNRRHAALTRRRHH
jgi:hypothetical protein